MYLLKRVFSRLLFPVPLTLEFLLVGLFLLWFTRRQRTGKALVTCGALLLLVLSSNFASNALLRPLERRYSPIRVSQSETGTPGSPQAGPSLPKVPFIVVLGGVANHDPEVPITSHLGADQMVRLVEGVILHRELPASRMILSGSPDSADGMAKMAEALGVSAGDIRELNNPLDTDDEGRQLAPMVRSEPFILVTSASHMPRAMKLFERRRLRPIPAPTDYLAPRGPIDPDDVIPNAYQLFKSRVAFYEYLGLGWETTRSKLGLAK